MLSVSLSFWRPEFFFYFCNYFLRKFGLLNRSSWFPPRSKMGLGSLLRIQEFGSLTRFPSGFFSQWYLWTADKIAPEIPCRPALARLQDRVVRVVFCNVVIWCFASPGWQAWRCEAMPPLPSSQQSCKGHVPSCLLNRSGNSPGMSPCRKLICQGVPAFGEALWISADRTSCCVVVEEMFVLEFHFCWTCSSYYLLLGPWR